MWLLSEELLQPGHFLDPNLQLNSGKETPGPPGRPEPFQTSFAAAEKPFCIKPNTIKPRALSCTSMLKTINHQILRCKPLRATFRDTPPVPRSSS